MKLQEAINRLKVVEAEIEHLTRTLQIAPETSFNQMLQDATQLIKERTELSSGILETELATPLDGTTTIFEAKGVLLVLDAKEKIFMSLLARRDLKSEMNELIFKELQSVRSSFYNIKIALESCFNKTDLLFSGNTPSN